MILCIDIGGTAVKMALAERDGRLLSRHEADVGFDAYRTPLFDTVRREAAAFLMRENAVIEGIGVSATGQIDTERGVVVGTCGNIPNYAGSDIKESLRKEYRVPVSVLNDANAAALGECLFGAGRGKRCVVMVTLGTGVGGGVVINGQVLGGATGLAGEIGHLTLHAGGAQCSCGRRGCMECYASTKALVARAMQLTGEKGLDGRSVFGRAAEGDKRMLDLIGLWTDDIAEGASGLVHIFNPDLLLIGGGVSAQEELLMRPLREKIFQRVMPEFRRCLSVERAALGNDAGLYGALGFLLEENGQRIIT